MNKTQVDQSEKVSVIVPIYNTGQYLYQCLDSIIHQTYQNIEILLINDGSSDGSADVCEEYAEKDSRVRVIHKKPQVSGQGSGVGATRNTALSYITGDYVVFVDHDDWLELNHVEYLYESLQKTGSDIAVSNFIEFCQAEEAFVFHSQPDDFYQEVYSPKEWFTYQYDGRFCLSQCFTVPWGKLYKAELLRQITYPEGEKVEDDFTTWKVYLLAEKIVYSNISLYCHRKHGTSVTRTVDLTAVFPLKSIEERMVVLGALGWDLDGELSAYNWRLDLHIAQHLENGRMQEYQNCLLMRQLMQPKGNS